MTPHYPLLRSIRLALGWMGSVLLFTGHVHAQVSGQTQGQTQAWPSQALRIVVPFAPGGSSDFIARLISRPLGEALGVSVLVENRAGNSGNLGAAAVAQAIDGHTVLLTDVGTLAIAPLVSKDLSYKLSDLKGVTMLGYSPHLLAIHPAVPANNLKELVEYSKRKHLNIASAGSGSVNHLGVVEIALATGMKWQHVPYKGGAQAMTDTMGGTTEAVLNGMLATLPHVQSGKLKAIAVSKRNRVAGLPQLATVAEQGVSDFESGTYQGVTAPASMPAANVARLNAALAKVMQLPEIRNRMLDAGAEVTTGTSEELNTFLGKEAKRWESVIKRAGAELEGSK
jgi:tripartite-type tricarboxylate transporter receptor subunit TctC